MPQKSSQKPKNASTSSHKPITTHLGQKKSQTKPATSHAKNRQTLGNQQQKTPVNPTMGPLQGTQSGQGMPGAGILPPSPSRIPVSQQQNARHPVPQPPTRTRKPKAPVIVGAGFWPVTDPRL